MRGEKVDTQMSASAHDVHRSMGAAVEASAIGVGDQVPAINVQYLPQPRRFAPLVNSFRLRRKHCSGNNGLYYRKPCFSAK
jgi:hypothetical protein